MAVEITMPKLSDTMEEGKILRWLKKEGDAVEAGEVIAEVETDKADMELEASATGVLAEIRVAEGANAAVGAVVAVLDGGGRASRPASPPSPESRAPVQKPAPAEPPPARPTSGTPRVSPLARRIADEKGVNLRQVRGSGPEGRITRRDVEQVGGEGEVARPGEASAEPASRRTGAAAADAPRRVERSGGAPAEVQRLELSKMRQTIARRMTEAKRDIPHFYVTAEIDMSAATEMRESIRAMVDDKVTITHLILKAAALALKEHPRVNGRLVDGAVEIGPAVNLGVAVAVEDGLLLPVIHGCERLSIGEIAAEARRLVERARDGHFSGDELKGGTFSVSNMGMLDIEEFSAVINPPQAAILAVGAIKDRAVVRRGQLAVGRTMRVTLSCDHRQLNGVEGGRFLETLKRLLENPVSLVLG